MQSGELIHDPVAELLKIYLGEEEGTKTFMRWYMWLTQQFEPQDTKVAECWRAVEDITEKYQYDQLIITDTIKCSMACPHHLLPVEMKVHIGYLPNGKILGLSKFGRIAEALCKPPKTQEQYTADLAKIISEKLETKWLMVMVTGIHSCMRHRGVEQQDSKTTTSAIIGDKDSTKKAEMMAIVYGNTEH